MRWLLRKFEIAPNAYYNFLKNRKADYCTQKQKVLAEITEIYHDHNGVDGYRSMKVYLGRKGYTLSNLTVHKYMNVELGLYSIVRKKRPDYRKGTAHHIFDNLVDQKFSADATNEKWCTDFTYLFLTEVNATIVPFWIFMTVVLLPALQIRISQPTLQYEH